MNKIILTSVVILVAIAGFIFANNHKETEGDAQTNQIVVGDTMTYTGDGYLPQALQVETGTTVTFINESDVHMWPASDIHPTHSIYGEFDPRKPIPPGESWQFTFDRIGEWGMHDHLAPYILGKIIVVDK